MSTSSSYAVCEIIDTFPTADLIRYGWLSFEEGLHNFMTVQIVLNTDDYERFRATMALPDRHPVASASLLTCAKQVNIPRIDGRVATSGDSEFGAFAAFTDFMSLSQTK
jgi:hypothetical protein